MSDTPETDAFVEMGHERSYSEFLELARKLERERDKAQNLADMWEAECLDQAEANGRGSEREAALFDALRGLVSFCEEDQAFASKAYAKTYDHAKRLVESKIERNS
jgi:hypothetical protein